MKYIGIKKLSILVSVCAIGIVWFAQNTQADISIQSVPLNGLAAYWSFDLKAIDWGHDTASDISGNGHTGTLEFMTQSSNQVAGKLGQGLLFDGTLTSVSLSSNPIADVSVPSSVCAWAKTSDLTVAPGGAHQTILNLSTDSNNGLRLGSITSTGALFVSYLVGGTDYGVQSTGQVFQNGNWMHVCYVWDGASVTLYANGTSLATVSNSESIGFTNVIGARDDVGDGIWDGSIDEVRVYKRALSPAEVQRIYQSGALVLKSNGSASSVKLASVSAGPGTLSQGLVGYWPFDGSTLNWRTDLARDLSGNSDDGLLINMSTTSSPVQGKRGQALKFDAISSVVETTAPASLNGTSVFTVSFWAAPVDPTGANVAVSIRSGTVDDNGFNIVTENPVGGYGPAVYWPAQSVAIKGSDSGLTFVNGKYHFYAFVSRSATDHELFVDGVSQGTNNTSLALANPLTNITIGAKYSEFGGTGFHGGPIDDVRVYNRALSNTEIGRLYNLSR